MPSSQIGATSFRDHRTQWGLVSPLRVLSDFKTGLNFYLEKKYRSATQSVVQSYQRQHRRGADYKCTLSDSIPVWMAYTRGSVYTAQARGGHCRAESEGGRPGRSNFSPGGRQW
jgi:hypothetical protein